MTAMSRTSAKSGDDTRQRLLLSALQLYAREGLHATSLRRISTAAGSKNSAAVHYHFNNKLGVVAALVEMIAGELETIDTRLRAQAPRPASLRAACRQTLLPLVQLTQTRSWGGDAIHFMARLVSESDPDIAAVVNPVYQPFWQQVDRGLSTWLPGLPAEVRRLRLMFVSVNVLHGMAEVTSLAHTPLGDLSHFDADTLFDHLVDYLVGGLQAPHNKGRAN
jgi:AcrR family transcriptional regulator